jgi:uncharacterized protein involved in copper resistance
VFRIHQGKAAISLNCTRLHRSFSDSGFSGDRTGPKGLDGLGVRRWTCINCQTEHDRDTLSIGVLQLLELEFSTAGEAKAGDSNHWATTKINRLKG